MSKRKSRKPIKKKGEYWITNQIYADLKLYRFWIRLIVVLKKCVTRTIEKFDAQVVESILGESKGTPIY